MPEKNDEQSESEQEKEGPEEQCPYCSVELLEEKEPEERSPLIIIAISAILLDSWFVL